MEACSGSSVLYHVTEFKKARAILALNRFRLMPVESNEFEAAISDKRKNPWYMSFARTINNDYFANNTYGDFAIFVCDGRKLGQQYSVRAVDYWHNNEFNKSDETEDRLFSRYPFIEAYKYIKECHFYVGQESGLNYVFEVLKILKREKIAYFFYKNKDDARALRKDKSVKPNAIKVTKPVKSYAGGYGYLKAWAAAIKIRFKPGMSINDKYELFMRNVSKDDKRKYSVVWDHLRHGNYVESIVKDLKNEINGGKTGNYGTDKNRERTEFIVDYMRRQNITEQQLVESLIAKFRN